MPSSPESNASADEPARCATCRHSCIASAETPTRSDISPSASSDSTCDCTSFAIPNAAALAAAAPRNAMRFAVEASVPVSFRAAAADFASDGPRLLRSPAAAALIAAVLRFWAVILVETEKSAMTTLPSCLALRVFDDARLGLRPVLVEIDHRILPRLDLRGGQQRDLGWRPAQEHAQPQRAAVPVAPEGMSKGTTTIAAA